MNAIKQQMKKKRSSKKKPEEPLTEEEERQEHELRMKIKQSLNTQQVLRNEVEETEQHHIQLGQQRSDGVFETASHTGNGMMGHPGTMNSIGVARNNEHHYDSRLPQHQSSPSIQEQMQEMQIRLELQRRLLEEQIQIKRHLQQHQQMAHAYVEPSQSHQRPRSEGQDQINPYGLLCQIGAGSDQDNYQQQGQSISQMQAHDQVLPHQITAGTDQYISYQTPLGDESRQSRRSIAGLDPSDGWLRSENGTSRCEMGFHDVGNMSASFSSAMDDDGEPFRSNSDRSIDISVARNESPSIEAKLPKCTQTAAAAATELNPIKENEESPEDEASNLSSLGQSSMTKGSLALSLLDENDFLNVVENVASTDSATNDALQTMDSMKMSLDSQTMKNLMKSHISMGDAFQDEGSSPSGAGTKRLAGSECSTGELPKEQRSNRGSARGREGVSTGGGKSSMMSDISQWCGSDNPFDAALSAASSEPNPVDEANASNGAGKCQGLKLGDGARARQANQSSSSQGSSHFGSSIQSISLSLMSAMTDDLTQSVQALDMSDRSRSND